MGMNVYGGYGNYQTPVYQQPAYQQQQMPVAIQTPYGTIGIDPNMMTNSQYRLQLQARLQSLQQAGVPMTPVYAQQQQQGYQQPQYGYGYPPQQGYYQQQPQMSQAEMNAMAQLQKLSGAGSSFAGMANISTGNAALTGISGTLNNVASQLNQALNFSQPAGQSYYPPQPSYGYGYPAQNTYYQQPYGASYGYPQQGGYGYSSPQQQGGYYQQPYGGGGWY